MDSSSEKFLAFSAHIATFRKVNHGLLRHFACLLFAVCKRLVRGNTKAALIDLFVLCCLSLPPFNVHLPILPGAVHIRTRCDSPETNPVGLDIGTGGVTYLLTNSFGRHTDPRCHVRRTLALPPRTIVPILVALIIIMIIQKLAILLYAILPCLHIPIHPPTHPSIHPSTPLDRALISSHIPRTHVRQFFKLNSQLLSSLLYIGAVRCGRGGEGVWWWHWAGDVLISFLTHFLPH